MSDRNHGVLYYNMTQVFSGLFNFDHIGILFRDEKNNSLYSIQYD